MKKKLHSRFPDFERVDTGNVVTFGTAVYMHKDGYASGFIIVFPTGSALQFRPIDDTINEPSLRE